MQFEEILKIHEEHDAVPKFYFQSNINGGILKLPSNIIKMLPEREVIYEVDGNNVLIYENKIKVRSINIEFDYSVILTMIIDMQMVCEGQGYCLRLCRVYDDNKKCVNKKHITIDLFNLIKPKASKKELLLVELISKFMETGSGVDNIPESIVGGCEFVLRYYMENKNND